MEKINRETVILDFILGYLRNWKWLYLIM